MGRADHPSEKRQKMRPHPGNSFAKVQVEDVSRNSN